MIRRASRPTLFVALFATVAACAPASDAEPTEEVAAVSEALEDGPSGAKVAPAHTFQTLDGEDISLADLKGQVVVVNFWGTWCLPCRRELPELAELAEAYADRGAQIVGIAVDSGEPADVTAFLEEFGIEYAIWLAGMETAIGKFGAVGFPFTLIVDREGWIRKEYLGPQTFESLSTEIDALLQ